ncbi:MAG: ribosome silencing factor [Microthrixaceae bacterium]
MNAASEAHADDPATELALVAARAADDKLATDIVVLDVAEAIGICDHFVLVSAANERQVKAVVDNVEHEVREQLGLSPRAEEGKDARRWVLLDYGDILVHVFHAEERAYYRLERLYGDVSRTEWRPEGHPESSPDADRAG